MKRFILGAIVAIGLAVAPAPAAAQYWSDQLSGDSPPSWYAPPTSYQDGTYYGYYGYAYGPPVAYPYSYTPSYPTYTPSYTYGPRESLVSGLVQRANAPMVRVESALSLLPGVQRWSSLEFPAERGR